jgi:hypothetical protein
MFEPGDDDLVACLDIAAAPRLRDQIDSLRRPRTKMISLGDDAPMKR